MTGNSERVSRHRYNTALSAYDIEKLTFMYAESPLQQRRVVVRHIRQAASLTHTGATCIHTRTVARLQSACIELEEAQAFLVSIGSTHGLIAIQNEIETLKKLITWKR